MNLMDKNIIERNKTSDNVLYVVDNKKCLCQHGKLHPLTSIKGKFISETIYRYFEGIIQQDSHRYIT